MLIIIVFLEHFVQAHEMKKLDTRRRACENIKGQAKANQTHFDVGKAVRKIIEELGGTMPENLPTPDKSIKQLEREQSKKCKKRIKGISKSYNLSMMTVMK